MLYNHGNDSAFGNMWQNIVDHTGDVAGSNGFGFTGVIDDAAFYSSVLSEERIKVHYETALVVTEPTAYIQVTTASIVSFSWSQSDPDSSTGSGTLTATVDGIEFSAPMPTPTMNQKDTTDAPIPAGKGVVGFANTVDKVQPGHPYGFHLGWSGTVTLTGSLAGKDYSYDVDLTYEEGDTYGYQADVFDNPDGGVDVTGGKNRFAGWIGDDGGGHRHSGQNNQNYDVGPDAFSISAGGNLGENGKFGDNVGITLGLREGTGGDVFVSNLVFTGTLQSGIPIEPPTLSIVNNGDGTVTVTFEGTLQAAASVNGPWADVDAPSPLTTPANEAMQYARAVR
jgi:hypothetical protein